MTQGDDELVRRLLAEAVHQVGGKLQVNMQDLEEQRGTVEVSREGDVITCEFSAKQGKA